MKYILLLLACYANAVSANLIIENTQSDSKIFFQEKIYDTLYVKNTSDHTIEVLDMTKTCGCTVIEETNFIIGPLSTKRVPISVDLSKSTKGKSVYVSFFTPEDTIQKQLNYQVKEMLVVDPRVISATSSNDSFMKEITITNISDELIIISNVDVLKYGNGAEIKLNLQSAELKPGESLPVMVTSTPLHSTNIGEISLVYELTNSHKILSKKIKYMLSK